MPAAVRTGPQRPHECVPSRRELIAKDREIRVGRVDEEKSPLQHGTSVTLLA
jgi:hypothetical protein